MLFRFVLNQRGSCPLTWQPFLQTCVMGDVVRVYEGLVLDRIVSGLQPYAAYDFQIVSYNSAGSVENAGWTRAETLQTSEHSRILITFRSKSTKISIYLYKHWIFIHIYL